MAQTGPGAILALVRGGVGTRAALREASGLSKMSLAQRVDALLQAGLVREDGQSASTGGRRPSLLRFDASRAVVLAASVDTTHTRAAVLDLAGSVLHEELLLLDVRQGPEPVLEAVEAAFVQGLTATGRRHVAGQVAAQVEGVGISLPAPVDPRTGWPSQPPIMPGWDGYPVAEHLRATLPVPVVVENDANAMAAGEQAAAYPRCSSLCLVKVSTGIGAGVVIGGALYRGIDGGAGDIGHVRLAGEDALCQCGSRGCLAAVASGGAVARALSELGVPATHGRHVGALLAAGDGRAHALVREAGRRIGEVLATVVCLLNPGVLVVAGDLASPPLVSGLREGLYPHSLPRATRNLEVQLTRLGDRAALVGLAHLVLEQVLSPGAVDARLNGSPSSSSGERKASWV